MNTELIYCGSVSIQPSSLGIRMYRAAYHAVGIPYWYVAMGAVELEPIVALAQRAKYRSLAVSMPFKIDALGFLDRMTEDVRKIGATNTMIFEDDRTISGYNTDWSGATAAIHEAGAKPRRAVIVGAGGAARALAYALQQVECEVFVAARRAEAADELVGALGLAGALSLEKQGSVDADFVVNCSSDASLTGPVDLDAHKNVAAVFDVLASPRTTPLIGEAQRRGLIGVAGWRMLFHQALEQFKLSTGLDAPGDVMQSVLEEALPAS